MKKYLKIILLFLILAFITFISIKVVKKGNGIFGRRINSSEVYIKELKNTEKLKVLTMYKEILVNEYKGDETSPDWLKSFSWYNYFSKPKISTRDQITCIYPCRLDFGWNLKNLPNWVEKRGDTVYVNLPVVEILNEGGLSVDEANKRTPIQKGSWTASQMNDIRQMAQAKMIRSCMSDSCYAKAELMGESVVRKMLESFGFKNIVIDIEKKQDRNAISLDTKRNPYKVRYMDDGTYSFEYNNGDLLVTGKGFDYLQLLELADVFSLANSKISYISKSGNNVVLDFVHKEIAGNYGKEKFNRDFLPSSRNSTLDYVRRIIGESSSLTALEVDKDYKILYKHK